MEQLYIALVDTPGIFAGIIRKTIGISYIHVVLSLDSELKEAYSFGRRNPYIPYFSGFEKENAHQVLGAFPTAKYGVYSIPCTTTQKENIRTVLQQMYAERFRYHYCITGLPFILFDKAFFQERHYTCSSFIGKLLMEEGVVQFSKHFSLITPRDFYELEGKEWIYQGALDRFLAEQKSQKIKGAIYGY